MRIGLRTKLILGLTVFGFLLLAIAFSTTFAVLNSYQDAEQEGLMLVIIFGALTPVMVAGAFGSGHIFGRWTIDPVKKISKAFKRIEKGDLEVSFASDFSDNEIGDAAKSCQKVLIRIRTLVKEVQQIGETVASSSQELASSSEQMNATAQQLSSSTQQISRGSSTQAERVEETAKIIGTMTKSVDDIATNSQTAKETSSEASEIAQIGMESVNESVQKMEQIYQSVNASADVIQTLGERSKEITQILDVITNITDQTNLLALNAAIEAARAGEHGRGFAVVAEEVKNLAEDSKEAADRIDIIIKEIQANTGKAVESMSQGTKEVSEGKEIVDKAGEALGQVAVMSQKTAELVEDISFATEQQKAGTEMVAAAIDEIATIAEESASASEESASGVEELTASMEEMTSRAQELSETAVTLHTSIGSFKVSGKRPSRTVNRPPKTREKLNQKDAPELPEKVAASLRERGIQIDEGEA
jgi:methyl-accepting chemotaxis protein